ncbi:MAG: PIN domain-containing protein [Chloroflexota bacterium]|nr:PIN domain-containing protein [Chloroflexota bacterium]
MALPFLDTNILLRHLLGDHPEHSPRATALLRRIERGEEARLSDMVVFETVFTLERSYRVPKDQIRQQMLALLSLPGLTLPGKRRYAHVFDLYVDPNLPFGDAYIAAEMERAGATQIYSFDREMGRLPGISRTEPPEERTDEES